MSTSTSKSNKKSSGTSRSSSSRTSSGRSNSGRSSAASSKGRKTAAGRSKTTGKKSQGKPVRREVGAVVCLLLCAFSALGYFKIDAVFITFFCRLIKGLCGYGFWITPPVLLLVSGILMFHRGRPVRLRVTCSLALPFLFGALGHVLFAAGAFRLTQFGALWTSGLNLTSGGAVSGWISVLFCTVFSRIGAAILFLLLLFVCDMVITRITPADIWDGVKYACSRILGFFSTRPEYEEEDYSREEAYLDSAQGRRAKREQPEEFSQVQPDLGKEHTYAVSGGKRLVPPPSRKAKHAAIDIPLDDDPIPEPVSRELETDQAPAEETAPEQPRRKSAVRAPHEVLEEQEAQPPVQAQPPVNTSAADLEDLFGPETGPEPKPEPKPEPAAAAPKSAVRKVEPAAAASERVIRSEAAVAAAMVRMGNNTQQDTGYQYPPVDLLDKTDGVSNAAANEELRTTRELLDDTIQSFGIDARIINVTRGPSVTRYELELMRGVKLNKLTNLAGDIALSLGAPSVRIAPITGRNSVVGVEVPNQLVTPVPIRDVIDSKEFRTHASKVAFAVGKDISGKNVVGNIAKLPHMLIAGTTGSGKSVCTNSLIISLLYKSSPEDVRLIMVDPKMVELGIYNGIPHLLIPVVTDPKKAAGALQWAVTEMMKRYRAFSEVGVRDLSSYNAHAEKIGEDKLPQVVVVIDELADLMLVAAKEVEESICRVAQMGRAAGMHLIIATQRPSSDVITGLMKANIPSRIAFAVASSLESRIILDTTGAEKLVGKGDMLYAPLGIGKPLRVQGCMISDEEVARVVEFIKQNSTANYDDDVMQEIESNAQKSEKGGKGAQASAEPAGGASSGDSGEDGDELLPAAIEVVVDTGMASVSMLQRRLKLGYSRAARLVDQMEERKIVGPFEGSKPRQVLVTKEQWNEAKLRHTGSSDLGASALGGDEFAQALAMSEAADAEAGMDNAADPFDEEDSGDDLF